MKNIPIVVDIHNNVIKDYISAESMDEAKELALDMAKYKLNRELNDEEISNFHNMLEIVNEDDADNIWCISIGMIEL